MTTARLARAGRSRFFIGIVALLLMIGFVAIFHSSQQQLDESKQLRLRCEQQQETLNTRLQAIIEQKFRLEKSLENERTDYTETKKDFERKVKEQKDMHSKAFLESHVRFESLQQHYKLLESEHNDLVEECAKAKETQLEQINGLERKVKVLQNQLQQSKSQKDKELQMWKVKYENIFNEKQHLEMLIKSTPADNVPTECKEKVTKLENLVALYKVNCNYHPASQNNAEENPLSPNEVVKPVIEKSFNEQLDVGDGLYKIPIKIRNNVNRKNNLNIITIAQKLLLSGDDPNADVREGNLQQPPPLHAAIKLTTKSTNTKTSDVNKRALPIASVANPTSEKMKKSSTVANDRNKELSGRYKSLGVAPVPENFDILIKEEEHNRSDNNDNNRYVNVVDALSGRKDDTEKDNAANEIKDIDMNIGDSKNDPKDHLRELLDNMNNAAEEDLNNFLEPRLIGRSRKKQNGEDENVEMLDNKHDKPGGLLEGDDKLINEVVGDQGKEAAFPEGLHMEEANEEDEDDDYINPAARQQEGPAVRN